MLTARRVMMRVLVLCMMFLASIGGDVALGQSAKTKGVTAGSPANPRSQTVGMAGLIENLILPGTELEVILRENEKVPVVLRIVNVAKHGTAYRYDLEYYGLDPGTYDLRDYLKRKDGSAKTDLPPISVEVRAVLPPGQIEPNALVIAEGPRLGGYRTLWLALGLIWIAVFVAILFSKRAELLENRRRNLVLEVTPAARLRPLVARALDGSLPLEERGELERAFIAYWMPRLNANALPPDEEGPTPPSREAGEWVRGFDHDTRNPHQRLAAIGLHPEAGPVLRALEAWLHRPVTAAPDADLVQLLRPYLDAADLVAPPSDMNAATYGSNVAPHEKEAASTR